MGLVAIEADKADFNEKQNKKVWCLKDPSSSQNTLKLN